MKSYKKRMKGSWCQGKGYKGDGEERQYAKKEIEEMLAEDEENFLHKYHKGKRSKNEQAILEYRVQWYEQAIEQFKQTSLKSMFRDSLRKAKEELELLNSKKK